MTNVSKISKVTLKTAPLTTFGKFHSHFKCKFHPTCDIKRLKTERVPLCEKLGCRCNDNSCENFAAKIECRANCSEQCENQRIRQNVCANIEVKQSVDTGNGLFAKEDINRGDQICIYAGPIIPKKEHEKRVLKYVEKNYSDFYAYKVGDLFVDPTESGNLARFANHSCSPNMVAERWQIDKRFEGYRTIVFIAKRPIREGDELTVHYGENINISQECRCGEDHCSGWIGQKKEEPAATKKPQTKRAPKRRAPPVMVDVVVREPTLTAEQEADLENYRHEWSLSRTQTKFYKSSYNAW